MRIKVSTLKKNLLGDFGKTYGFQKRRLEGGGLRGGMGLGMEML